MTRLLVSLCFYKATGGDEDKEETGRLIRIKITDAVMRDRLGYLGYKDAP